MICFASIEGSEEVGGVDMFDRTIHVVLGSDEHTKSMISDLLDLGITSICVLDYSHSDGGSYIDSICYFSPRQIDVLRTTYEKVIYHKYFVVS
jgi:hypothetical protein